MIENSSLKFINSSNRNQDDIDFKEVLNFILRNKVSIFLFTLISFILMYIFSLSVKKTWQGEFQIVLSQRDKSNMGSNINPAIKNLVGMSDRGGNNLKTEVGILESPSVLMPIFDYVTSEKGENIRNNEMIFSQWKKNNLNINLEQGTSILSISYKDKDKTLILPVLEKMSSTYQEYSGRNKRKEQDLRMNYLSKQIDFYKLKSSDSLKRAQEFAIDEDLILVENSNSFPRSEELDGYGLISKAPTSILQSTTQVEITRVKAANEIKRIDMQIKQIEELGNDLQKLQYIGTTIPSIRKEGLPRRLSNIEEELVEKRSKYKETDLSIKSLIEQRDLLINLLKKRSLGHLNAQRLETESLMISAMRPKNVLLKYKEYVREANRDEETLIQLENQFRINELEQAKKDTPWELITNPTLIKNPVGPNKKIYGLIGISVGLILGIFFAYMREKISDKVYDINSLSKNLNVDFINSFNIDDLQSDSYKILLLREFIEIKLNSEICFISFEEIDEIIIEKLKKALTSKSLKVENINYISSINKLSDLKTKRKMILLVDSNKIKYSDIKTLNSRLIFKNNLFGLISLDLNS